LARTLPSDTRGVQSWVLDVEKENERAERLVRAGEVWAPPPNNSVWATGGRVLGPMNKAISVRMGKSGILETAVKVVTSWEEGESTLVTAAAVDWYLIQVGKDQKQRKIKGPKRDRSGNASSRPVSAILDVAALLREHGRRIRHDVAVAQGTVESTYDARMTKAHLFEESEERVALLESELAGSAVELTAQKAKTHAAQKEKSAVSAGRDVAKNARRGTADRVRTEEKAISKVAITAVKEKAAEMADEALRKKAARKQELATAAHADKRA
jgi:hypothetical protein